jgi:hypothetical protein
MAIHSFVVVVVVVVVFVFATVSVSDMSRASSRQPCPTSVACMLLPRYSTVVCHAVLYDSCVLAGAAAGQRRWSSITTGGRRERDHGIQYSVHQMSARNHIMGMTVFDHVMRRTAQPACSCLPPVNEGFGSRLKSQGDKRVPCTATRGSRGKTSILARGHPHKPPVWDEGRVCWVPCWVRRRVIVAGKGNCTGGTHDKRSHRDPLIGWVVSEPH